MLAGAWLMPGQKERLLGGAADRLLRVAVEIFGLGVDQMHVVDQALSVIMAWLRSTAVRPSFSVTCFIANSMAIIPFAL